jgi:hypothetical protein
MQELSTIQYELLFKTGATVENLAQQDDVLVRFKQPGGAVLDKTLLLAQLAYKTNGTDGIVTYRFTTGEAVEGEWDVQGKLTDGAVVLWTNVRSFYLNPNI